jgi:hypothetical protein
VSSAKCARNERNLNRQFIFACLLKRFISKTTEWISAKFVIFGGVYT